jgi:hypothetical protein
MLKSKAAGLSSSRFGETPVKASRKSEGDAISCEIGISPN